MRDYDWGLMQALLNAAHTPSDDEWADKEVSRLRREYHPGSSIIAWVNNPLWANAESYAQSFHGIPYRGTVYRSGNGAISEKYDRATAVGEINPSR